MTETSKNEGETNPAEETSVHDSSEEPDAPAEGLPEGRRPAVGTKEAGPGKGGVRRMFKSRDVWIGIGIGVLVVLMLFGVFAAGFGVGRFTARKHGIHERAVAPPAPEGMQRRMPRRPMQGAPWRNQTNEDSAPQTEQQPNPQQPTQPQQPVQ